MNATNLIETVDERTFESSVLRASVPVLIDLYADWCAPCKQLAPIVEEIAREHQGKLKVVKVDVERSPAIAAAFGARSIPMLVLMNAGQPVDARVGLVDKAALVEMLKPILGETASEAATAVEPKELQRLINLGKAQPVDVRDAFSFGRYRVPTAINLPKETLLEQRGVLRAMVGKVPVLYDRTEDEARTLAEKLGGQGIAAAYLKGGFLGWEADGLDVERGI